jgi:hypothetical protein
MKKIFAMIIMALSFSRGYSQNIGVNATGAIPHPSAMLDVSSTTKGMLIPRMTAAQRIAISSPATGLQVYDTDNNSCWFYNGSSWAQLSAGGASSYWLTGGSDIYNNNAGNVGIGINTPIAKFHIKGSTNTSQLIIDASATQSNTQPLIKLRDASGVDLLHIHSDNTFNTFIGLNAGRTNTVSPGMGVANTFIGSSAGFSNNTGFYNTGIGQAALFSNTTGISNTAIGQGALYSNLGDYNNAFGVKALFSNTSGIFNTANGYQALYSNSTGSNNTANGYKALYSNDGTGNTANGFQALTLNTSGNFNTANGQAALFTNTVGSYNTANGTNALFSNTAGNNNTANGNEALSSNNTGSANTANGNLALFSNVAGTYNTANGSNALFTNFNGHYNTAAGVYALSNNIGGSNNIAIGAFSGTHLNTPNIFNTISIGNDDMLNAYQNQVFIGNTSTGFIGGKVPWSVISDARVKNTINEDVKGLDFIMKLRPVTYHVSNKAITMLTGNKETPDFPGKYDCEKIKYSGFLAQEVEQAAKAVNYDFSGYAAPKNEWGFYSLSYEQFVVPLVKAMQEQQKIIEEQKTALDDLKRRLVRLEEKIK